ncbi:MAG: Bax inhibitor-1/YccA family protein [Alphaproteobacteria bacterium]|nr:Bax inhibitor-1/YccA family protein [Alphaproteobacteria bacterium]
MRKHMLGIYNYMASGVLLTGIVAYLVFTMAVSPTPSGQMALTAFGQAIYLSPLKWVLMLSPLAFILVLSFGIQRLSASATQGLFWVFCALMGASISSIFLQYTGTSIARVFFITAAAFAGLSLYGYTTKRDLSGMRSFLVMGLIGVIIASLVNIFLASSALHFAVSVIGVLVFAGFTAYDTQRIKSEYYHGYDTAVMAKKSVMDALSLYLSFINMFLLLLSLFGNRE